MREIESARVYTRASNVRSNTTSQCEEQSDEATAKPLSHLALFSPYDPRSYQGSRHGAPTHFEQQRQPTALASPVVSSVSSKISDNVVQF